MSDEELNIIHVDTNRRRQRTTRHHRQTPNEENTSIDLKNENEVQNLNIDQSEVKSIPITIHPPDQNIEPPPNLPGRRRPRIARQNSAQKKEQISLQNTQTTKNSEEDEQEIAENKGNERSAIPEQNKEEQNSIENNETNPPKETPRERRRRVRRPHTMGKGETELVEPSIKEKHASHADISPSNDENQNESVIIANENDPQLQQQNASILTSLNIPNSPQQSSVIYKCTRKKSFPYTHRFSFIHENTLLFSAKTSDFNHNMVYISANKECHIKGIHDFLLIATNFHKNFELKHDNDSKSLLDIEVSEKTEPLKYARYFDLHIYNEDGITVDLNTEMPHKNSKGQYVLSFGPTFIKDSIKNAILLDSKKNRRIIVRKISDDLLNIELIPGEDNIPLYAAFSFGLASWLCPY